MLKSLWLVNLRFDPPSKLCDLSKQAVGFSVKFLMYHCDEKYSLVMHTYECLDYSRMKWCHFSVMHTKRQCLSYGWTKWHHFIVMHTKRQCLAYFLYPGTKSENAHCQMGIFNSSLGAAGKYASVPMSYQRKSNATFPLGQSAEMDFSPKAWFVA